MMHVLLNNILNKSIHSNIIEEFSILIDFIIIIEMFITLQRNHIFKSIIRCLFSTNTIRATQKPSKATPQIVPIRISFQQQNLAFVDSIFSMQIDKPQLQKQHKFFLTHLTNDSQKGKQQFEQFQSSTKDLYSHIKRQILIEPGFSNDSEFIGRSHYYFQSQGKKIRPTMVNMLAATLNNSSSQELCSRWGALIEMMHISSLAHDDIIDDSPSRRGVQSQHIRYGKRSAVFSANFTIAKASQAIHRFGNPKLYQIYSLAMDNLATGEIIQAITKNSLDPSRQLLRAHVETYIQKSYYKTAALMANALRAVPVLCGKEGVAETESFRIGQHFGLAFQIVDDVIDYTSTAEEMGKQNLADIIQGNVTAPVYFSFLEEIKLGKPSPFLLGELRKKDKTKEAAEKIKQWIFSRSGIQLSLALAAMHVKRGLQHLQGFSQELLPAWKYLGYKLLTRRK